MTATRRASLRDAHRPGGDAEGEARLPRWRELLSHISTDSRIVTAEGSAHDIPGQRPDVIVEVIREMLATVRARSQ